MTKRTATMRRGIDLRLKLLLQIACCILLFTNSNIVQALLVSPSTNTNKAQQQLLVLQTSSVRGASSSLSSRRSSSSSTALLASESSSSSTTSRRDHRTLEGVVCVVTGASRGIGKGIALALGKEGATVYITGTSSSSSSSSSTKTDEPYAATMNNDAAPGTIEETAAAVTNAGGLGIAVRCNHAQDDQVKALFQKVEEEQGRLDILVNNAFRIPAGGPKKLFGKFWEQDVSVWDNVHTVGLRSHYVATAYAMPLLLKSSRSASRTKKLPRPFVAMISSFGGLTYTFNVAYGVAKAGVDRLAKDMATELANENICVTSFWPGLVLTETTQRLVDSGEWEETVGLDLTNAESPEFTGRAIVAVATDPSNDKKSGTSQVVAELAQEYQFTDVDGVTTPPSIRSLKFLLPAYGMTPEQREQVPSWMIPDWKLPFWVMASGRPPAADESDEARAI